MATQTVAGGIGNVADGIGGSAVFGQRGIIQIEPAGITIKGYIFQDGAETAGGFVNLRFSLGREVDYFGITASLKIEDTPLTPTMFVITDQAAFGIGRESGFARSR